MATLDLDLESLTNEELLERVAKGYYSEEALPFAKEELKKRGLEIPTPASTEKKESFQERHPVLTAISLVAFISWIGYKAYDRHFVDRTEGDPNYKSVMERK